MYIYIYIASPQDLRKICFVCEFNLMALWFMFCIFKYRRNCKVVMHGYRR